MKLRKWISLLLSCCMLFSVLPVTAAEPASEEDDPAVPASAAAEAAAEAEAPVWEGPVVPAAIETEPEPEAEPAAIEPDPALEAVDHDPAPEATEAEAEPEADPDPSPAATALTGTSAGQSYVPEPDGQDDPDALLFRYVDILLGKASSPAKAYGSVGKLSVFENRFYNELLPMISAVANGNRTSTVFEVPADEVFPSYTAEELGVGSLIVDLDGIPSIADDAQAAFLAKTDYDLRMIVNALLADLPYALYWYDKTANTSVGGSAYSVSYDDTKGDYVIYYTGNISFLFPVAAAYAYTGQALTYEVSPTCINSVRSAKENADEIVAKYASDSDADKLAGYRTEICALVSYNTDAAENDATPYGDPWQMIWVFDGDDQTNVVCEGYAKAFQYLCDETNFSSSSIRCVTVSGVMTGGTGAGSHMWNIVRNADGKNTLVDVTNCDAGTVGADTQLFLALPSSGSVDAGYTFYANNTPITYAYSAATLSVCDTADLVYTAAAERSWVITFEKGDEGATGSMDPVIVEEYSDYTLPPCGFTPPEGKVFAGWNYSGNIMQPGQVIENIRGNLALTATYADPMTWDDVKDALEVGDNVTLTNDVTRTDETVIGIGGEKTLNLNGYTLDCSNCEETAFRSNGSLTITDSSANGTGTILFPQGDGSVLELSSGASLTLAGGTLKGDNGFLTVVSLENGSSFTMTGGRIKGAGDGVMISHGSSFTMTGGEISACITGVDIRSGSFTMTGGSIIGCGTYGASVDSDGAMYVSGSPVITGNGNPGISWTGSVKLDGSKTILVTDVLGEGAEIGVRKDGGGVIAEGTGGYTLTADDAARFTSNDSDYLVRLNASHQAELYQSGYTITFEKGDEEATGSMAPVIVEEYSNYALPPCGFTPPEGKMFAGWNYRGNILQPGAVIENIQNDLTLTATYAAPMTWDDVKTALEGGNDVTLTNNVTRTDGSCIDIGHFNATLNLNGFTLDCSDSDETAFRMSGSSELTITDSANGGGTILVPEGSVNAFVLASGASMTLAGGTLMGENNGETAVFLRNRCSFTMTGGCIKSVTDGVKVNQDCSFTMTGGEISECTIGVAAYNGSFTMTGGRITGCRDFGVAVDSRCAMYVSGSPVIAGNGDPAKWYNGNVEIADSSKTILVTGALGTDAEIGVTKYDGGVIAEGTGDYTLTAADAARFTSDDSDYLVRLNASHQAELYRLGYTITFEKGDEGATGSMAPVIVEKYDDYTLPPCGFTPPEGKVFAGWDYYGDILQPGEVIENIQNDLTLTATYADPMTWDDVKDALEVGDNVTLTNNVTRTDGSCIDISHFNATLNLNGFTLDCSNREETAFRMDDNPGSGTHLTIKDSSANGTGTILLPQGEVNAFLVDSRASLTLAGGTLKGGETAVCLWNGSSFTMTGGSIEGTGNGVIISDSRFTMTDGEISGCNCGVKVLNGSFTMTGGRITGCRDYGVTVGSDGAMYVSGSPVITGNGDPSLPWTGNVELGSSKTILVTGVLGEAAEIGVTKYDGGVIAEGTGDYTLTADDAARFTSDDPAYAVRLNESHQAELSLLTYSVTIDSPHGTVVPDKARAARGETVTLTVTPESGYFLDSIAAGYFTDPTDPSTLTELSLTKSSDRPVQYTFTMPAYDVYVLVNFTAAAEPYDTGHSILLSGQIGLDFYYGIPAGKSYTNVYLTFSGNEIDETIRYDKPGSTTVVDGVDYGYRATVFITSIQLADAITPTVHYTEDGVEKTTVLKPFSAENYLRTAASWPNETDRKIGKALADYGYYAQRYLSKRNQWTLGTDYAEMTLKYTDAYDSATVEAILAKVQDYAIVKNPGTTLSDVKYNLRLDDTISLSVMLTPANGVDHRDYEYTMNIAGGMNIRSEWVESAGYWLVTAYGIKASELKNEYSISIGGAYVKVSVLSYVQSVLNDSTTSSELRNMCCALWTFADACSPQQ